MRTYEEHVTQLDLDNNSDVQEVLPGITVEEFTQLTQSLLAGSTIDDTPTFVFDTVEDGQLLGKQLYQIALKNIRDLKVPGSVTQLSEAGKLINSKNLDELQNGISQLYQLANK